MARQLDPCPTCSRHIAEDEAACPMCGGALPRGWSRGRVPAPPAGTGRAVRFAWRFLLATSATACGARTDLAVADAAELDGGGGGPIYGLPADLGRDAGRDAGHDAAIAREAGPDDDAGTDAGEGIPIYGSPPPDGFPTSAAWLAPPDPILTRARRRRR